MADLGLLLLRLGFGACLFFFHGWSKLLGFTARMHTYPDSFHIGHTPSLVLATFAEVFCAFAIVIGLLTRWMAIPPLLMGIVFAAMAHGTMASKEMPLLYAVGFLAIILLGPGSYSIDWMVRKKR